VLRLGDGRQTAEVTHQIPAIHRGRVGLGACYIPHDDERIAA
jgi:hypothetical protein